jgi:predicted nucleic acid-binding protein
MVNQQSLGDRIVGTTDSHLAAPAVEANATLHTADTDFLRLAGRKWMNPLM